MLVWSNEFDYIRGELVFFFSFDNLMMGLWLKIC